MHIIHASVPSLQKIRAPAPFLWPRLRPSRRTSGSDEPWSPRLATSSVCPAPHPAQMPTPGSRCPAHAGAALNGVHFYFNSHVLMFTLL